MNKSIYNLIPSEIKDILFQSEGWLVGSSVEKLLNDQEVRDYDILVTDLNLYNHIISANKNYFNKFTTFGGLKFIINNIEIDIWYQPLSDFIIKSSNTGKMYNLRYYKILNLEK